MSGWYYRTAGKPALGPVSASELRVLAEHGSITSNSEVSHEQITRGKWVSANRIKGLTGKGNAGAGSAPFIVNAEIVDAPAPFVSATKRQSYLTAKTLLVGSACLVGLAVLGLVILCSGTSSQTKPAAPPNIATPAVTPAVVTVQLTFWDATERRPLRGKPELWVRGVGSIWLRGGIGHVTGVEIGKTYEGFLYADGREGNEIKLTFGATADMNPKGAPGHALIFTVEDEEVEVLGEPFAAVNDSISKRFAR